MSTNISRRKVVAGAAWAAPVVAASAVVPAFASSTDCADQASPAYSIEGTSAGAKTVQKFKVPAKVDKINFVIKGGPGGTQYPAVPGGRAAMLSGSIAVKEGQTVEIVAAAGGIGNHPLTAAEGGEGYGNGGSSKGSDIIPSSIISKVNAKWSGNTQLNRSLFSSSGGGSSALIIDGTVIAVAGGGGGVGVINAGGSNINEQYKYPGAADAGWWKSDGDRTALPYLTSKAGSVSGLTGGAGEQGSGAYTVDHSQTITVEAGKGGAGGVGGIGGTKTALPTATSPNGEVIFYTTNNQEIYASSATGNAGGDGFTGAGADGVGSYSYQIDNNDSTKKEEGVLNGKGWALEYPSTGFNFNGRQSVVSAGGGAGYGGGGSGASTSSAAILKQKWNNNPTGLRQPVGFGQQGGAGGAGGSYLAPDVIDPVVATSEQVATNRGDRKNGSVVVTFCQRS